MALECGGQTVAWLRRRAVNEYQLTWTASRRPTNSSTTSAETPATWARLTVWRNGGSASL